MQNIQFRRIFRGALLTLVMSAVLLPAMSGTAWAHAQLEGSDPQSGSVLTTAPSQISLTFGESVEIAPDAIEVFDDHLARVTTGGVTAADGAHNRILVRLRGTLRRGTYTVSWHVSSSDTHPVSGTFAFSVGAASTVTGNVPGAGRNDSAGLLLGLTRTAGYFGLVLGPGLLIVVLALWPAGLGDRRTRSLVHTGLGLLLISTLGGMLLQGVWANGAPLSAIVSSPSSLNTHSRRFDLLLAVRFYLLAVLAVTLFVAMSVYDRYRRSLADRKRRADPVRRLPRRRLLALIAVCSAALLPTWSLAGHAAAASSTAPLAIASDLLHVAAMSLWLGGLVLLTFSLRPAEHSAELARVLPLFSRLAFTCVTVLVLSGTFQAWREVGSVDALIHTPFGQLLLVKLVGVIVLLILGNLGRRWVQRHLLPQRPAIAFAATAALADEQLPTPAPCGTAQLRTLRRSVAAELVVGAAVLALTAALVVMLPAKEAFHPRFEKTLTDGPVRLTLRIDAVRRGDNILHLTAVRTTGAIQPIEALTGSVSLPSAHLGPLAIRVPTRGGAAPTGREDIGLSLLHSGKWTIQLAVTTSEFDATSITVEVPIP